MTRYSVCHTVIVIIYKSTICNLLYNNNGHSDRIEYILYVYTVHGSDLCIAVVIKITNKDSNYNVTVRIVKFDRFRLQIKNSENIRVRLHHCPIIKKSNI